MTFYFPTIKGLKQWDKYCKDWHKLVLLKLGILRKDFSLKMKNGLVLLLKYEGRDATTSVLRDIYFNDPYFKSHNFKQGDVIVDVGANIGIPSTKIAAENKGLRIYSDEASLENYKYLKKNIVDNKLTDKISCFNLAVTGKSDDTIKLYINNSSGGGNSIFSNGKKQFGRYLEVKTISMEDIFLRNKIGQIDFLKMDCEGAEYEILYSTPKKFFKKIEEMAIEYHNAKGHSGKELKDFIEKLGFTIKEFNHGIIRASK